MVNFGRREAGREDAGEALERTSGKSAPLPDRKPPSVALFAWGAVVGLVASLLTLAGVWEPVERLTMNVRYVARALWQAEGPSPHVVVVAIDEPSLEQLGQWPWDRRVHARLIQRLKEMGAASIALDVLLEEPSNAAADEALARSLADAGNVVLPVRGRSLQVRRGLGPQTEWITHGVVWPLAEFASAAAAVGHINVSVDSDGVVRTVPLTLGLAAAGSDLEVEPLAVAAIRVWARHHGFDPAPILSRAAGGMGLPWPHIALAYRLDIGDGVPARLSPAGLATTLSYADVLAGRVDPERVAGRIVFVGLAAPLAGADRYLTPYPFGPVPGVFVHAVAADTLLGGAAVRRVSRWAAILLCLAGGMAGYASIGRFGPIGGLLVSLGGIGLYSVVSTWGFVSRGLLVDVAGPCAAVLGGFGAALLQGYRQEAARRRRTRDILVRFVSPAVADHLLRRGQPGLGGERTVVTVLFADLRGFTGYAEKTAAEEVVRLLNACLTEMAGALFAWEGTLCKYTGDGLMAIFGAPLPQDDQAWRALAAAFEMRRRLRCAAASGALQRASLAVGIGVATGEAVVGNIGSPQRLEYTAIGDVVNVAARLEDLAEPWGILATEETVRQARHTAAQPEDRLAIPLPPEDEQPREIQVVGRSRPLRVYSL